MMKFEYKTVIHSGKMDNGHSVFEFEDAEETFESLQAMLNHCGKNRWELVSQYHNTFIFKRAVQIIL